MSRRCVVIQQEQWVSLMYLQSTQDATKFYENKVEELGGNLKALEKILQEKTDGLRMVEDGQCHNSRHRTPHSNLISLQCCGRKLSTLVLHLHHDTISQKEKYARVHWRAEGKDVPSRRHECRVENPTSLKIFHQRFEPKGTQ